jgi:hypothetical protein
LFLLGDAVMFRFFSSSRASIFEERRKKQAVWRAMRRIMDIKASAVISSDEDDRQEPRYPTSMPVLVQGFDTDSKCSPGFAISKNISEITPELIFCAVWEEQPLCFIGLKRQSRYAGAGYWEVGIEFQELASLSEWEELRSLAMSLNPDK